MCSRRTAVQYYSRRRNDAQGSGEFPEFYNRDAFYQAKNLRTSKLAIRSNAPIPITGPLTRPVKKTGSMTNPLNTKKAPIATPAMESRRSTVFQSMAKERFRSYVGLASLQNGHRSAPPAYHSPQWDTRCQDGGLLPWNACPRAWPTGAKPSLPSRCQGGPLSSSIPWKPESLKRTADRLFCNLSPAAADLVVEGSMPCRRRRNNGARGLKVTHCRLAVIDVCYRWGVIN
jgi:hypothetical protein